MARGGQGQCRPLRSPPGQPLPVGVSEGQVGTPWCGPGRGNGPRRLPAAPRRHTNGAEESGSCAAPNQLLPFGTVTWTCSGRAHFQRVLTSQPRSYLCQQHVYNTVLPGDWCSKVDKPKERGKLHGYPMPKKYNKRDVELRVLSEL